MREPEMPTYDNVPNSQMRFGIVSSDVYLPEGFNSQSISDWVLYSPESESAEFQETEKLLRAYARPVGAENSYANGNYSSHSWSYELSHNRLRSSLLTSREEWRYLIIKPCSRDSQVLGSTISRALRISQADLKVDAWAITDINGVALCGGQSLRCAAELSETSNPVPRTITYDQLSSVDELARQIQSINENPNFDFVKVALERFENFDDTREGVLKMLG
jgi:hypothetical protein